MLRCLGLRRFTAAGFAWAGCLSQMPKTETAQKRQSEHCGKRISTLKGEVGVSFLVCVMIVKLHCQRKPRTTNLNWSTAPMKVEEIAEAVAKLSPDQLARFHRWFTAFEAGRTDRAQEL